jgi:hypothetical protein
MERQISVSKQHLDDMQNKWLITCHLFIFYKLALDRNRQKKRIDRPKFRWPRCATVSVHSVPLPRWRRPTHPESKMSELRRKPCDPSTLPQKNAPRKSRDRDRSSSGAWPGPVERNLTRGRRGRRRRWSRGVAPSWSTHGRSDGDQTRGVRSCMGQSCLARD